ncbi:hypothetical protein [Pseudonocardia humida]|uniref:Peptidase n=1 Tax=Pseudonocardia humida TaxID=2800819 RepID=A0ABT0ZT37_9PSEU|nr:hypothetical protein [Pseudonocardia humida]MCO1653867.1 hypothetical protein [Pseudonocardia humida]
MRSFALIPVLVVAAIAAAAGPASAAPPAPDPGSVGVRLLDVPTVARDDPRARQYIVDHLAPGAVVNRRIMVSNTTREPMSIAIYPAAAVIEDGSFLGADGRTANELSTWTTLSSSTLDLAPGAEAEATVTVSVPADAAPGERYGAAWAEVRAPGDAGVVLVNRVGIRMYLSVGDGNAPASDFTVDSLTAGRDPDGRPVVTAQLHNTGGRALDMSGALALSGGPGALTAGPFPVQVGSTVAPGRSTTVTIAMDRQLPDGPWDAALTLRSGLLEESVDARIQFPAAPGLAAPVAVQDDGDGVVLLVGALILLVALLIVVVVVLLRRRRRETAREPR